MTLGDGSIFERADDLDALGAAFEAVTRTRRGAIVVLGGEAGIGKTTLVDAFCAGLRRTRVLAGACEALYSPRPLGPFADIGVVTGGPLREAIEGGVSPSDVAQAFMAQLRGEPPAVVVLEDLHWADEATLDVLRVLSRRIDTVPALVVGTYRDDELDRGHPLRVTLGEMPRTAVTRILLRRLSRDAVAAMAEPFTIDAAALYERTGGNPFYVSEALAAGADAALPDTVRDAVLARASRLDPDARQLLEAVAIVPPRAELRLLESLTGGHLEPLEACMSAGMLRTDRDAVAFRHELARVAIEETLPPGRRLDLHRRALAALVAEPVGRADPARLAHHAAAAGDSDAVLKYAPAAGARAAAVGAHREAAAQYALALQHAAGVSSETRADLLERRSYECYLIDAIDDAITARRAALEEHRTRADQRREGDAHRWLSRLAWFLGDRSTAEAEGARAIEVLEALPPGPELAMAYSNMSQLHMLGGTTAAAKEWGMRAIALAEQLGETETLAHALNNVGSAEFIEGLIVDGTDKVERSLSLALTHGFEEHAARAYTNLGVMHVRVYQLPLADRYLDEGIAYCTDHDLDSWRVYMAGWRALSHLRHGAWSDASADVSLVLDGRTASVPSRITALTVLGLLRARRGDPDPWSPLDEAARLADATSELLRISTVAVARAEARWLAGEAQEIGAETDAALALAHRARDTWSVGELLVWRRRAGITPDDTPGVPDPFALELALDWASAAARWHELGCPYAAALALAETGDETRQREAIVLLTQLGAHRTEAHVARLLRKQGVRNVRRGPRASTRSNAAGLTAREVDVLQLLAEGLRNPDLASRLVVSQKTVEHHVSAVLRKLDAATRTQAVANARRLGILET